MKKTLTTEQIAKKLYKYRIKLASGLKGEKYKKALKDYTEFKEKYAKFKVK